MGHGSSPISAFLASLSSACTSECAILAVTGAHHFATPPRGKAAGTDWNTHGRTPSNWPSTVLSNHNNPALPYFWDRRCCEPESPCLDKVMLVHGHEVVHVEYCNIDANQSDQQSSWHALPSTPPVMDRSKSYMHAPAPLSLSSQPHSCDFV